MSIVELQSDQEFKNALAKHSNHLVVTIFSASFAESQCQQMRDAIGELVKSAQPNSIVGFQLDADKVNETVKELKIECIPSVLLFANSKQIGSGDTTSKSSLETRLKQLINSSYLMIFMKGSKTAPRCGFSKQLVAILNDLNVTYETFDVLSDEDVRQGIKTYASWPTFPLIFWKGELVGGLDIIKEMVESGEFQELIKG